MILSKYLHGAVLVATLLMLSVWVRQEVFGLQTRAVEGEAPFILESALQYRMTEMVYHEGALPALEPMVEFPDGVSPAKTYSLGAEWLYAGIASLLPEDWSLPRRVRWASVFVFSVGVPLFALWAGLRWSSRFAAWVCGLVLATSPAFAVRSSGLNLSRENLALPLMGLFLLAECKLHRQESRKQQWAWASVMALAIALSQMFWDMTKYLLALWVLKEWGSVLLRHQPMSSNRMRGQAAVVVGLVLAGCTNPYLWSHGFAGSFFVAAALGILVTHILHLGRRMSVVQSVMAGLLCAGLWMVLPWWPRGEYNHFFDLLVAKVKFLNQKPLDPSLLNFSQRIMWTPALNSSTWALTRAYFPIALWGGLFAWAFCCWHARKSGGDRLPRHVIVYGVLTLATYVLFFRFHVFLIVFCAFGIAGMAAWIGGVRSRWVSIALGGVLLGFLGKEVNQLLYFDEPEPSPEVADRQVALQALEQLGIRQASRKPNAWGPPGFLYPEMKELTEWLRTHAGGKPVLANFGVSGPILAYGKCPIILHPKFETAAIRERVEHYATHLFRGTELQFRNWADTLGAQYYVYSNGEFSDASPSLSLRYMVDALTPADEAPARIFEYRHLEARWFQQVFANRKYRVFRIVTKEDEHFADDLMEMAHREWIGGQPKKALERARAALHYDWKHEEARRAIQTILNASP